MGFEEDFNKMSLGDSKSRSSTSSLWKRVIPYPDHRYYVCFPCPRGVLSRKDIKFEFRSSTELAILRRLPAQHLDPIILLNGITNLTPGAIPESTHGIMLLQASRQMARNAGATLENVLIGAENIWEELDIITFEKKTTKRFLDAKGDPTTKFYVGSDGHDSKWVTFWVEMESDKIESNGFKFVGDMFPPKETHASKKRGTGV